MDTWVKSKSIKKFFAPLVKQTPEVYYVVLLVLLRCVSLLTKFEDI